MAAGSARAGGLECAMSRPAPDGTPLADGLYAAVGARLRRARLARKLSLETVSEHTGVTTSFLGQIERGERKPSLRTFFLLARALRAPYHALLDDGAPSREENGDRRLHALLEGATPAGRELAYRVLRLILRRR